MRKCNKTPYTKKTAEAALNYIHKIEGRSDQNMPKRIYRCNTCQTWHITKMDDKEEVIFSFFLPKDFNLINKINTTIYEHEQECKSI